MNSQKDSVQWGISHLQRVQKFCSLAQPGQITRQILIDASGHPDKMMHKLAWLHETLVKLKPIIILYKWWYKRELAILCGIKPWTPFCVLSIFWRVLQLCQEPNVTSWCVLYVWKSWIRDGHYLQKLIWQDSKYFQPGIKILLIRFCMLL